MKRFTSAVGRLMLCIVLIGMALAAGQRGTEAQTATPIDIASLTGDWMIYPLIAYSSGVAVTEGRDFTTDAGRPVTLALSADGQHLVAIDNALYSNIKWFMNLSPNVAAMDGIPLAQVEPNHYGVTLGFDGTGANFDSTIDLDLLVVSDTRIDVIQRDQMFELMLSSRSALVRGTADPRPALMPYPACAGAPVSHLTPNQTATVTYDKGLNLRDKPSKSGVKLAGLHFQDEVQVLEGPTCADNLAYWKVIYNGQTGWVSEGTALSSYWLGQDPQVAAEPLAIPSFANAPYLKAVFRSNKGGSITLVSDAVSVDGSAGAPVAACPGGAQPRLTIGGQATVLPGDPNVLNTKPAPHSADSTSQKIALIPSGDIVDVVGGPVCANNITWWQVNYLGKTGWTGEMQGATYWMQPLP